MPIFLMRPAIALRDSSAAPLRLVVSLGDGWALHLQIAKRRGPVHEGERTLAAVSPQLARLAAARLPPEARRFQESHHAVLSGTDSSCVASHPGLAIAECTRLRGDGSSAAGRRLARFAVRAEGGSA
ncbi:hypothetical protein [Eleftheria terrae]|uniref:hypothetical protein n=1 Tax=Eleftheria terrae TaxID=1597781 RepID=UPI00263ADAE7|nr:hypothetical protein [Eleftheria terrae]WKB56112.1 hypothetical protein N7L95_29085 [Eleftheria terrae]